MKRSIALVALLAASVHAENVVINLDLSDSVREHLCGGGITAIKVMAWSGHAKGITVETTNDTAILSDLPPGKWKITTMMVMRGTTYVLDPPGGIEIEVPAARRLDVTIPITAVVLAGRATLRGEPFHGQMNLWPSKRNRESWGFAVPFDEKGRFAFPLPRAGNWDLRVMSRDRTWSASMPAFEFRDIDALREIEIAVPESTTR